MIIQIKNCNLEILKFKFWNKIEKIKEGKKTVNLNQVFIFIIN